MSTYLLQILIFSEIYTLIFITLKTIVTVFTGASKRAFFTARTSFFFVVESTYARINTAGVTITWINTVIQMSFDCTKVQWPDKIWPVIEKGIFCKLKFFCYYEHLTSDKHFLAKGYSSILSQGRQAQWLQFEQPWGHPSWQGHTKRVKKKTIGR